MGRRRCTRIDDPIKAERLMRLSRIEQSAYLLRKQSVDTKEAAAALLRGGPGYMKDAAAYLLHGGSEDTEVAAPGLLRGMSVHTKESMAFNVAHKLRSGRRVLVPNTDKPGPQRFRKRKKSVYDLSWQIPACVKVALEHYNRLNEDDVHELVKAVDGHVSLYIGESMHANFIAKSKQGGPPKGFFAELKIEGMKKISCTMCTKMDPDDPKTAPVRGECGVCPSRIFHPAAGGHIGANPAAGDVRAEDLGAAPGGGSAEFASLFKVDLL